MSKVKELAVQAETKLPANQEDPFAGLATGMENVTAADLLIPRLTILQGLSPQVTRGKAEYDETAKVGDIYDAGMGQAFNGHVRFLPVHYSKRWLEWAPRATGKGLQGMHDESIVKQCHKDEDNRLVLPSGNYVQETAQLFGFNIISEDYWRRTFIPFTSTQLKKARRLMTLAMEMRRTRPDGTQYVPPLFFRTYDLSTVPESNNQGSWMGWKIDIGPNLQDLPKWNTILREAIAFQESIASGEAKADVSGLDSHASGQASGDDIPF